MMARRMRHVAFEITMPVTNTWNGRSSLDHKHEEVVRSFRDHDLAEKILERERFSYSFGDGWVATIKVREVDGRESLRIKRKRSDFWGYGWMVDSIVDFGKILPSAKRSEAVGW